MMVGGLRRLRRSRMRMRSERKVEKSPRKSREEEEEFGLVDLFEVQGREVSPWAVDAIYCCQHDRRQPCSPSRSERRVLYPKMPRPDFLSAGVNNVFV